MNTPLKWGVAEVVVRHLPEGVSKIAHPFKDGIFEEYLLSPEGLAESLPRIAFVVFDVIFIRPFGTDANREFRPGSKLPGYSRTSLGEKLLEVNAR